MQAGIGHIVRIHIELAEGRMVGCLQYAQYWGIRASATAAWRKHLGPKIVATCWPQVLEHVSMQPWESIRIRISLLHAGLSARTCASRTVSAFIHSSFCRCSCLTAGVSALSATNAPQKQFRVSVQHCADGGLAREWRLDQMPRREHGLVAGCRHDG